MKERKTSSINIKPITKKYMVEEKGYSIKVENITSHIHTFEW
jgi:hypothetical protein